MKFDDGGYDWMWEQMAELEDLIPQPTMNYDTWVDRSGREWAISEMSDAHLTNVLRFQRNRGIPPHPGVMDEFLFRFGYEFA